MKIVDKLLIITTMVLGISLLGYVMVGGSNTPATIIAIVSVSVGLFFAGYKYEAKWALNE